MRNIGVLLPLLLLSCAKAPANDETFDFELNGDAFTYSDGERTFSGILLKPNGDGPFPAVIINHGQGGTVESFSRPMAEELVGWGLVAIAPELTHRAGGDTSPIGSGDSPENVARGVACANVLASLDYVDASRIALFGHSKGAYATIGQAAALTTRIRAASITAGGIVDDAFGTDQAAPTHSEASTVTAPFILFHGDGDTTVAPAQSLAFAALLDGNGVPENRIVYATAEHNLHQVPSLNDDIMTKTWSWWQMHGVLP